MFSFEATQKTESHGSQGCTTLATSFQKLRFCAELEFSVEVNVGGSQGEYIEQKTRRFAKYRACKRRDGDLDRCLMEQMTPLVQDVCCLAAGVILQKLKLLNDADGEVCADGGWMEGNGVM